MSALSLSISPRVLLAVAAVSVACKTPAPTNGTSSNASAAASAGPVRHNGPVKPRPSAEPSVAIAGHDASTNAGDANASQTNVPAKTAATVGLPSVDFGAPGPLVITGYPQPLDTGMRDYATAVAYSRDGSEVVACGLMTPLGPAKGAEQADTCFARGRSGKTERFGLDEGANGFYVGTALASRLRTIADAPGSRLRFDGANAKLHPPPVKTTWRHASDITLSLDVVEHERGSAMRIGGTVRGHDAVYPVTIRNVTKPPELPFTGAWNAVVVSPDESELAFVVHFFCMEWCNDVVITRLPKDKIASLVFNDTGFRAHQKKDFARSRDLFLKATWADARAPLPPYNLACAYAQLGDETNAAKALELAIAVAGDGVKARALKDADFERVQSSAWFRKLTAS